MDSYNWNIKYGIVYPLGFTLEVPLGFTAASSECEDQEKAGSVSCNARCSRMAEYGWGGGGLSEAARKKAEEELHEFPHSQKEAIEKLRSMITTRPDIGFLRTDDAFLLRFLRARKFNLQCSFNLLVGYFDYRHKNKSIFRKFNANEPGIKQALLDGFPGVLSQRDSQGRRVLVFFTANWDHLHYSLLSIYRALMLSLEKLIEEEETQINGFVMVIDWSGFTFRQSSHLSPKVLRLIIEGLQDCFPGRFAGIHFINQPWYVEAVLTVIRPFLKEKTKQKIMMHGNNLTLLHSHIPREVLPAELGGAGPPYNTEQWAQELAGNEFFAFSDRNIYWPQTPHETSDKEEVRPTTRSETFPSNIYNDDGNKGKPSVTQLDEDFFLKD